jgi:hypothetical protein
VTSQRDKAPLQEKIHRLQETIRRLEEEREQLIRRRRRNLLMVGVALSIVVHVGLMTYLNSLRRSVPEGRGAEPVSLEFAVLHDEELTRLQETPFEELVPDIPWEFEDISPADDAKLDTDVSAASLDVAATGAVPALGGSGGGEGGDTLGGGGAGTSFFGVSSRGSRFAYIVDVSGSMRQNRKLDVCLRELARSIETLPDYAYFFVALYSNNVTTPPYQNDWERARRNTTSRLIRWLNEVDPHGGTRPAPAFHLVFNLETRADVVFFLTDGLIPPDTARVVAELNSRGRRVVVNTIAFGDPTSQDLLKEIARSSGGVYRFVPSGGP